MYKFVILIMIILCNKSIILSLQELGIYIPILQLFVRQALRH